VEAGAAICMLDEVSCDESFILLQCEAVVVMIP